MELVPLSAGEEYCLMIESITPGKVRKLLLDGIEAVPLGAGEVNSGVEPVSLSTVRKYCLMIRRPKYHSVQVRVLDELSRNHSVQAVLLDELSQYHSIVGEEVLMGLNQYHSVQVRLLDGVEPVLPDGGGVSTARWVTTAAEEIR